MNNPRAWWILMKLVNEPRQVSVPDSRPVSISNWQYIKAAKPRNLALGGLLFGHAACVLNGRGNRERD